MRRVRVSPAVWVAILAPVALLLGYLGYRSLPGPAMSHSDALFGALQLFALEASLPSQGTPWQLNIARFLAPLALLYAAVLTLVILLREQVSRVTARATAREHVLLLGLSRRNSLLATSLRKSGCRVVVVEADANNSRIPGVRASGALVLVGDAAQEIILRRARAHRARHVVVATGDDSQNLEVAEQVRKLAAHEPGGHRMTVHVAVASQSLWLELAAFALGAQKRGCLVQFYNLPDRAAQAMLNEAERITGDPVLHEALIEGDGELAQRTAVHLVRRAALAGVRPRVHLSLSNCVDSPSLLRREPWLTEEADITARDTDVGAGADTPAVVLVCEERSNAAGIARALVLSRMPASPIVFVSVHGRDNDNLLDALGVTTSIHLVATQEQAVTQDFLRQSATELMARVRHEDYVAQERARGVTPRENPSVVAWEDLPESLKESNRRFAEAVGEVLETTGARLVPLRRLTAHWEFLDPAMREELAIKEHERWVQALQVDGWTYAAGPKDADRKTHPLLVPWSDLDEVEKEKDRDAIRAIPRMLARVGYAVELPEKRRPAAEEAP